MLQQEDEDLSVAVFLDGPTVLMNRSRAGAVTAGLCQDLPAEFPCMSVSARIAAVCGANSYTGSACAAHLQVRSCVCLYLALT